MTSAGEQNGHDVRPLASAATGTTPPGTAPAGAGLPNPRGSAAPARDVTSSIDAGGLDARHHLLTNLTRNVTARLDLADVLAATFTELRTLVRFTGGSIQLVDDEGWIRFAATDPAAAPEVFEARIPLHGTVAGRIVLTERPVYLPDVLDDGSVASPPPKANLSPDGVRSYFGVPLLAEGRAIGVLQIDSTTPAAWDDTDRMLVVCAAPVVAAAIQNARVQASVRSAQASHRRIVERWRVITTLLDNDVDDALRGLVEMSESVPTMREEVDRLTGAIACVRAVAGEADRVGRDDGLLSLDLRAPQETRR